MSEPRLQLAPMRGLTDSVFRTAIMRVVGGFDSAIAPFVKIGAGEVRPGLLADLLPERNQLLDTVPQLLGKHPAGFLDACRQLKNMGYAAVNWNLGCPYGTVTKKGMGAGLLPTPQQVDAFLDEVLGQSDLKVSVKVRLGLDNPKEILSLSPVFNAHEISELIVHPRTAKQMYDGPLDLDALEEIVQSAQHPVTMSGEIKSLDDYTLLKQRFSGVSSWMIGRGVIANPLLTREIKELRRADSQERKEAVAKLHQELYLAYQNRLDGPGHVLQKMQGFWPYLSQGIDVPSRVLKKIRKARTLRDYELAVVSVL